MKNLTVILALFLMIGIKSQIQIVNDPKANSTMLQKLAQGKSQLIETKKQYQILKETKEQYDKVNNKINQLNSIKEIYNINKEVYEKSKSTLKLMKDNGYSQQSINNMTTFFTARISKANNILEFVNDLLISGRLKMNDFERITLIEKYLDKAEVNRSELLSKTRQIEKNVNNKNNLNKIQDFIGL